MPLAHRALLLIALGCPLACSSSPAPVDSRALDGSTDGQQRPDRLRADAPRGDRPTADRPTGPCAGPFQPCGGELSGTWSIVTLCPEDPAAAQALYEHPNDDRPECRGAENPVLAQSTYSGTMSFDSGTMTFFRKWSVKVTYGFSKACLTAIDPANGSEAACANLQKPGKLTCSFVAASSSCSCTGTVDAPDATGSAPYTLNGNELITQEARIGFCVSGTNLTLDWTPHPVSWRWWILKR